ncbi:TPA: restriction endonuclease subunit S [Vibrio parahaemolyticus]|nr:restriction endonuclease subunit S [Vibrio parahaemolyticus]
MSFEQTPLNEFITLQRGFDLPKGDRAEGAVPVIASTGVGGYHNTAKVEAPGVVIGRSGSIGGGQYIQEPFWPLNTTLWVKDFKGHDPRYIYYLMRSIDFTKFNVGSGVPTLNRNHLSSLLVNEIGIDREKTIAKLLGDLDDKIALNTQTNQTLEEMAQAIFKSWFVDFDPVKAKMNGEQPEGMDAATASLFPDKLDSETGIPVGWSQGIIADIAKLNAKSWTKKNQPEQVHYVDLANTKNGVIETVTTYDFEEAPSRARRVLNSGDTIVGTVRPGNRSFAFIGETEQPLTGSTGFAVLSPKKEFWTSFVYLATTNDDAIDEYARLADGGAYPAIKPVVVADTPCVIPTTDIAQKFWQLTGAMLKKAHQNRLENEELAQLRDTLLPKLLSGEIELGQAQELAEVE